MKAKQTEDGFHLLELAIVIVVIAVIGFVGYSVFQRSKKDTSTSTTSKSSDSTNSSDPVKWAFNEQTQEWFAQEGTPPKCKEPFVFDNTPVNLDTVMVISMPGAYRGYNYKPHGGFRLTDSTSGKAEVKLPMDATLVGLKRYYEGNPAELQYLLTFESDCGIAFRFDHLYTLTPDFQKIAETTPEPKLNDTRSDPNEQPPRVAFKAGTIVATEIGFPKTRNYGFDFGVYDYRKQNEISKNAQWKAIHNNYTSLEWFGVCWLNMLPGADSAKATALSQVVINPARPNIISDYCSNAQYKTLDFNSGQPTDG